MAALDVEVRSRQAEADLARFRTSTERATRSTRELDDRLRRAEGRLRRTGQQAQRSGQLISTALFGISGAVVFRDVTRTIVGFEESLAQLRGVAIRTTEALATQNAQAEALERTARVLGASTRFSAQESAEGLLFLARAGFDVDQAIAALPATLNLAQAGMLGLGQAADLASNVVSQFSLRAEETERVADALVVVSNRANTSVSQLGDALKFAGPVAAQLGNDVETTAAALGVLGDRGIQATLAGTGLRTSLLALASPSREAEQTIKRLGLSLDEVNPERNDLVSIFERFGEAQLTASDAADIFGKRNAAVALILSQNTDRIRELTVAQTAQAGEAERLAEIMDATLGGSLKALRSSIEEVFIELGEAGLGDALKSTVDLATDVARAMGGVRSEAEQTTPAVAAMAGGVKVLVIGLGTAGLLGALNLTIAGLRRATSAMRAFLAASIANPIIALGVAVAAVTLEIARMAGAFGDAAEDAKRLETVVDRIKRTTEGLSFEKLGGARGDATQQLRDLRAGVEAQKEIIRGIEERPIIAELGLTAESADQAKKEAEAEIRRLQAEITQVVESAQRKAFDERRRLFEQLRQERDRELEERGAAPRFREQGTFEVPEGFTGPTPVDEEAIRARKLARTELDAMTESLRVEAALAGQSRDVRELLIATIEAERLARASTVDGTREQNELVAESVRLARESVETRQTREQTVLINETVTALNEEHRMLGLSRNEREIAVELMRIQQQLGNELADQEERGLRTLLQRNQAARQREAVRDTVTSIQTSVDILGAPISEQRERAEVLSLEARIGRELTAVERERIEGLVAQERALQRLNELSVGLADSIVGPIEDAAFRIQDSEDLKQLGARIVEGLGREVLSAAVFEPIKEALADLAQSALQELGFGAAKEVTKATVDLTTETVAETTFATTVTGAGTSFATTVVAAGTAFASAVAGASTAETVSGAVSAAGSAAGGVGSAFGNVFTSTGIQPFQLGGVPGGEVVHQPSLFTFAGGRRLGSIAEQDPEAILPLQRDPFGRLGVQAVGGSQKARSGVTYQDNSRTTYVVRDEAHMRRTDRMRNNDRRREIARAQQGG